MTCTPRVTGRVAWAAIAGGLWSVLAVAPAAAAPSTDESAIRQIEDGMVPFDPTTGRAILTGK